MSTSASTTFHEEQRFRQPWVWLLVLGVAALQWWGWIQQIVLGQPFGDNPGPDWMVWLFLVLFGIGLPLFFVVLRLVIEVNDAGVWLRYFPLTKRMITFDQIERCEAVGYQPLRQYGGWGIRGLGSNRAYNVSGSQGVRLHLRSGDVVVIGSQRSQELALAIDTRLPRS
ncbi:MAG TPA: DUF6141 family protein [Anaerolineae bacterium]|nr:DUF6141 family protein [Anaerolineae bacterium]